jgi:hypothetical protein
MDYHVQHQSNVITCHLINFLIFLKKVEKKKIKLGVPSLSPWGGRNHPLGSVNSNTVNHNRTTLYYIDDHLDQTHFLNLLSQNTGIEILLSPSLSLYIYSNN